MVTTSAFDRYTPLYQRKPQSEEDQRAMEELRLLSDSTTPLPEPSVDVTKPLEYNEDTFRQLHIPVLWQNGWTQSNWQMVKTPVVQWNHAAEIRYLSLLRHQLWPIPPVDCSKQKYAFIPQSSWGYFSRWSIFIRSMLTPLSYPDRMLIYANRNAQMDSAPMLRGIVDDVSNEGIQRFFLPVSQCQGSEYVQTLLRQWGGNPYPSDVKFLDDINAARPGGPHHDTQWVGFHTRETASVTTGQVYAPHWMRRAVFDYGEARSQLEERYQAARGRADLSLLDAAAADDALHSPVEGMTKEKILFSLTSRSIGAAASQVWRHLRLLYSRSFAWSYIFAAE